MPPHTWARHWFLTSLIACLAAGMGWPQWFPWIQSLDSTWTTAVIIGLMALPLDPKLILQTASQPAGVAVAIVVNIGLLPLLAWCVGKLLPAPMAAGLVVACCIPSTLASSAVLTRRAGGNEAVALMVMLFTNLGCFLYTPFLLQTLLGARNVTLAPQQTLSMAWHLTLSVVLPFVLGQSTRQIPGVVVWVTQWRKVLSVITQLGLLSMVLKAAVKTGIQIRLGSVSLSPTLWACMLFAVVLVHVAGLWLCWQGTLRLGGSRNDAIGAALSGSQKTLMVGLDLATLFFPHALLLPIVAYHCCQLILDTMLADQWAHAPRPVTATGASHDQLRLGQ